MNEIEKMYKLANIAKPVIKKWYYDGYCEDFSWKSSEEDCTKLLKYFDNSIDKLNDRIQQMKKEENTKYDRYTDSVYTEFGRIEKAYMDYPPFTAEKQIEITKFLISKHAMFNTKKDLYMVYHECRHFPRQYLPFGEALAESINYLWQSLTSEEKQQVKEILE